MSKSILHIELEKDLFNTNYKTMKTIPRDMSNLELDDIQISFKMLSVPNIITTRTLIRKKKACNFVLEKKQTIQLATPEAVDELMFYISMTYNGQYVELAHHSIPLYRIPKNKKIALKSILRAKEGAPYFEVFNKRLIGLTIKNQTGKKVPSKSAEELEKRDMRQEELLKRKKKDLLQFFDRPPTAGPATAPGIKPTRAGGATQPTPIQQVRPVIRPTIQTAPIQLDIIDMTDDLEQSNAEENFTPEQKIEIAISNLQNYYKFVPNQVLSELVNAKVLADSEYCFA